MGWQIDKMWLQSYLFILREREREIVPTAPFLAGVTIKTKAATRNFPRHLHTYLLVDCTGFALTAQIN